ncbi:2-octaprenyl-6-methoxyphenyl hydroxylase [Mesobaculum littorinae]|uniref:2-octaprenyl-6-methoxyphenyl hydroxylase n=1 Tax=Mesobaculum littorinae TaxID=2486419 RepID=A0A438ADC2_9RHOB|nr:FAD-dependent oxidoreductase [Mesobaculum littorinae]RVV96678.1 2-octaprenyl-6-methoxyphenyl hydroxylase [Mesobaculum littorinae]
MRTDTDILIAGAGLNGSTLALALAREGFRVTLVDPAPPGPLADGRSYALSLGSVRALKALDLWGAVAAEAQPILRIAVSDGRAGEGASPLSLHFDHAEIEEGPMGQMVEDRHLRPALTEALTTQDITRIDGVAVTAQTPGPTGVEVSLSDGRRITATLLVGCDGGRSATARRAGIDRIGWRYWQTALVATVAHELPHEGTAHQFFMPEGPLAILPLRGNRASLVWSEDRHRATSLARSDDAGYLAALRPRFGDFLGEITLLGGRFSYPLGLSVARRFVADRVALLGDAAHVVHPIAGQGLNAGIKDMATLAQVLVEARRRGEDFGRSDVLERYQAWRRFDVATLALATDGINRLFSNDNPLLRATRDLGLAAVNALPGLRRGFIREAAGLTGDSPLLLQGRPI